jgi:hypothetical protein
MKRIFLLLVLFLFATIYSCKDDSTSSTISSSIVSTSYTVKNDTLDIKLNISGTTYTEIHIDSSLSYSGLPTVKYDLKPTAGYGDFLAFNASGDTIYNLHFTDYKSDSTYVLTSYPKRYKFSITDFTGTGRIRVVR